MLSLRGKYYYTHNGKLSSSGAFSIKDKSEIFVKIPRLLGAKKISLVIKSEDLTKVLFEIPLNWTSRSGAFDVYSSTLQIKTIGVGLYFSHLKIDSAFDKIYAYREREDLVFSKNEPGESNSLQISVSDFSYKAPTHINGGVIYHVFVDRFYKAKNTPKREGSVVLEDWNAPIPELPEYPGAFLKNNYFYGGNLYGIIEKLDYIKSLGVNVLYLSPIFDSPSNHKYDTANYMKVDEMFGGDEALKLLISKAKEYKISVILDGVFNHTGADSIYFNKFSTYDSIGAYQSKDSKYYSWYDFKNHPDDYTCWWGINILPRINPDKPECREYFVGDGGVIEKYAEMGVSGFRLDVVDELSDEFVSSIKARLNKHNKASILYGEVWEDGSNKISYGKRKKYFLGRELDGVMNYPIREGIISYLRDKQTDKLSYALTEVINNAPERIRNALMNLLGSHDTVRIITALHGESHAGHTAKELSSLKIPKSEYMTAEQKLCAAYTVLATVPGIPSIYYGDEVGLQGYQDPLNRLAFPWGYESSEILSHYKLLGKIRNEHPVYYSGEFKLIHLSPDLLLFSRSTKSKVYLTAVNNASRELTLTFSEKAKPLIFGKADFKAVLNPLQSNVYIINKNTKLYF